MDTEKHIKEAKSRIDLLTKKFNLNSDMQDFFNEGKVHGIINIEDTRKKECFENIPKALNYVKEHGGIPYYYYINQVEFQGYNDIIMRVLYVGKYEEDWEVERLSSNNQMYVRVFNFGFIDRPELGFANISSLNGELIINEE